MPFGQPICLFTSLVTVARATGLALLVAGGFVAMAHADPEEADQSACMPDFPYKDGWLGGDGVYSIPISETKSVWLFGDTFVARPGSESRRAAALIANSVAVSTCHRGRWSIGYHWAGTSQKPDAVFRPGTGEVRARPMRYWPLDGHMYAGALWVFLMRVETVDPDDAFGFAITGTDLAEISNPMDLPDQWRIRIHPLARKPVLTGAGLIRDGEHLVLASPLEGADVPEKPVILTRLPLDDLRDAREVIQTLTKEGAWRSGIDPAAARRLVPAASSELSIDRDPRGSGWLMMHMDPQPFSGRVILREAAEPGGPWPEGQVVLSTQDGRQKTTFCYAAKAHPQFARPAGADGTPASLLVTYACNSTDFESLLNDLDLYRPQVVRLDLPEEAP